MQLQTKPKYYGDFNKHMDESYYNYEAYEIEYGYEVRYLVILTSMKSSPRLERANIRKYTWEFRLQMIRMLSLKC
jgi:hypothetical protein